MELYALNQIHLHRGTRVALHQAARSKVRIGSGTDADRVPVDVTGPSAGVNLPECDADSAV